MVENWLKFSVLAKAFSPIIVRTARVRLKVSLENYARPGAFNLNKSVPIKIQLKKRDEIRFGLGYTSVRPKYVMSDCLGTYLSGNKHAELLNSSVLMLNMITNNCALLCNLLGGYT